MRYQGRITSWKDDKGFGFITPNGGKEEIFLHISAFRGRQRRPEGNELVTYELVVDGKGRSQAKAVAYVGERPTAPRPTGRGILPPLFATCFLLFVAAMALSARLHVAVLGIYLAASAIAFVTYAVDKTAARRNQWRTRESTLHLFALLGGWPGALAAQRLFRHKSSKASFQFVFWVTVVLNCGALVWVLLPSGAQTLRSALGAM